MTTILSFFLIISVIGNIFEKKKQKKLDDIVKNLDKASKQQSILSGKIIAEYMDLLNTTKNFSNSLLEDEQSVLSEDIRDVLTSLTNNLNKRLVDYEIASLIYPQENKN